MGEHASERCLSVRRIVLSVDGKLVRILAQGCLWKYHSSRFSHLGGLCKKFVKGSEALEVLPFLKCEAPCFHCRDI